MDWHFNVIIWNPTLFNCASELSPSLPAQLAEHTITRTDFYGYNKQLLLWPIKSSELGDWARRRGRLTVYAILICAWVLKWPNLPSHKRNCASVYCSEVMWGFASVVQTNFWEVKEFLDLRAALIYMFSRFHCKSRHTSTLWRVYRDSLL